jgi:hypothetical protein
MALQNFLPQTGDIQPREQEGALGATAPGAAVTGQQVLPTTALQQFQGLQPQTVGALGATGGIPAGAVPQQGVLPALTGAGVTSVAGTVSAGSGGLFGGLSNILGFDTSGAIEQGLAQANKLIQQGIDQIGLTSDQARQSLAQGTLNASDLLSAGLQSSQGFITEGQQAALGQIDQQFTQAQQELGLGRGDISGALQQSAAGLQPFTQAGAGAVQQLAAGATPEGFGRNIEALRSGGALDPLIAERTRALQSAQGAAGLTRSGAGITELAGIPQDILLGIESNLAGRQQQLAGQGLGAQQQLAGLQAQAGAGLAGQQGNIAQLLAQQGQLSAGIQTGAFGNLANLAQGTAQQQAGLQAGLGGGLANIFTGQGQDIASLLAGQAQAQLAGGGALAGAQAQGIQGVTGLVGDVIGGFGF